MQLITGITPTTRNYILKTFLMHYKKLYKHLHPQIYYHSLTKIFDSIISNPDVQVQILMEDEIILGFQIWKQVTSSTIQLYIQHVKSTYVEFNFYEDLTQLLPICTLLLLCSPDSKIKEQLEQQISKTTITVYPLGE